MTDSKANRVINVLSAKPLPQPKIIFCQFYSSAPTPEKYESIDNFQYNFHSNKRSENALLSHCGRVTYISIDKLTIIGSDNGLLPGQRQVII